METQPVFMSTVFICRIENNCMVADCKGQQLYQEHVTLRLSVLFFYVSSRRHHFDFTILDLIRECRVPSWKFRLKATISHTIIVKIHGPGELHYYRWPLDVLFKNYGAVVTPRAC